MNENFDTRERVLAEYRHRLGLRRSEVDYLARRNNRISNLRLLLFALFVVLTGVGAFSELFSPAWGGIPLALFAGLVFYHGGSLDAEQRARRAVAFYEAGLARMENRWAGGGTSGEEFSDEDHLYACDLDLFGRGSLYELLCAARTRMGERTLAEWLKAGAESGTIAQRQAAVAELAPLLDFREDLWTVGVEVRSHLHPEALVQWAAKPIALGSERLRWLCAGLSLAAITSLVGAFWTGIAWPFLLLLAVQIVVARSLRKRVLLALGLSSSIGASRVDEPLRDLEVLGGILSRIEAREFTSDRLKSLARSLETEGIPPSRRIARLDALTRWLDQGERNQLLMPLAALVLWRTQMAFAIEAWRKRCGSVIPRWLEVAGELEALGSLAGFSFENPDYPFPEIAHEVAGFEGENLGHPLLPRERCVRNSVLLGSPVRLMILSGSNMSGKSTLLRTVGINTVLALTGAPVCARRMRLSPLNLGASIRLQDSIQGGISRFYAEIKRIKRIADLAGKETPVLFLLDEILQGTNSHDREIGARAILERLIQQGALGIATTHDLALTRIADSLAPIAINSHFEDQFEEDRLTFDYRLRQGVVRKSNALALMRSIGLLIQKE